MIEVIYSTYCLELLKYFFLIGESKYNNFQRLEIDCFLKKIIYLYD